MKADYQSTNTKKWDEVWGLIKGNDYPHEQLVKYVNVIGKFPAMKALDIGFGSGANMKFLYEKGFHVSGIEVSQNSIDSVMKKISEWKIPLNIMLYAPPRLPFEDNIFGLVFSIEAIYYNLELEMVIDEIYRVLAPNGKIYISFRTPNHGVIKKHAKFVGETLMEWKDDMPTKELAGVRFRCFKKKEDLYPLFGKFANVRVDTLWTDLLGEYFELLLVTGRKPK